MRIVPQLYLVIITGNSSVTILIIPSVVCKLGKYANTDVVKILPERYWKNIKYRVLHGYRSSVWAPLVVTKFISELKCTIYSKMLTVLCLENRTSEDAKLLEGSREKTSFCLKKVVFYETSFNVTFLSPFSWTLNLSVYISHGLQLFLPEHNRSFESVLKASLDGAVTSIKWTKLFSRGPFSLVFNVQKSITRIARDLSPMYS